MAGSSLRMRFGTTRVRSGCITCKSRHLKCDERRPVCQRCISSRRTCEFMTNKCRAGPITAPLRIVRYVAQLPQAPSSQPAVAPREARSLEFFQLRTAQELGGAVSGEAWSRFTLQACHEKAVLHAVVALSSLHEHYGDVDYSSGLGLEFPMQQYSKAIREIVKLDFAKSATATDVALTTCLLFALFESLQSHYKSAVTHVSSGIKIINEHQIRRKAVERSSDAFLLSVYLFKCMETQMLELGDVGDQYPSPQASLDAPISFPSSFLSVEEAMTSLEHFRCTHMRLSEYYERSAQLADDIQEIIDKRRGGVVEALENWSRACESMLNKSSQTKTDTVHTNIPGVLLLRIHKAICKIGLRLTSTSVENSLDTFGPEFRAITNDAARFIRETTMESQQKPREKVSMTTRLSHSQRLALTSTHPPLSTKALPEDRVTHYFEQFTLTSRRSSFQDTTAYPNLPGGDNDSLDKLQVDYVDEPAEPMLIRAIKPAFSMGLGIIMPLFIVCFHCRDPGVRRQALRLLKICNRKEGLWDSQLTARVAEMVITVEEQEALRFSQGPEHCIPTLFPPDGQVPEQARIHVLSVKFAPEKQATITYTQGGFEAASDISSLHRVDRTKVLQW